MLIRASSVFSVHVRNINCVSYTTILTLLSRKDLIAPGLLPMLDWTEPGVTCCVQHMSWKSSTRNATFQHTYSWSAMRPSPPTTSDMYVQANLHMLASNMYRACSCQNTKSHLVHSLVCCIGDLVGHTLQACLCCILGALWNAQCMTNRSLYVPKSAAHLPCM